MINKKTILTIILLVLCCLTSYAQVRIEVVPPFIEGGGSPSWNENRNTPNSVSEDVFELKNGSTIKGNLESFSGGVYFVNIGGITKSIPEKSILKINGQFLSSVKATVPDKMTAEVKIVKLDYKSLDLLFNKLGLWEQNTNKAIIKNNKLILDNDKYVGYYKINGNDDYYIRQFNGVVGGKADSFLGNIGFKDNESFERLININSIPLKVDGNGVYCLASNNGSYGKNDLDVYFYRYGAKNLDGPVGKCDKALKGRLHYTIDKQGLLEIAAWTEGLLTFYKSLKMNNGRFTFRNLYEYFLKKESEHFNTNSYYYSPSNGLSFPLIGHGHFVNKKNKNWAIIYCNVREHKVTRKKDSELYIDILNEDLSKGIEKSFHFIIPPLDSTNVVSAHFILKSYCIDIDRDGIVELIFKGNNDDESTKNSAIIVKLK